ATHAVRYRPGTIPVLRVPDQRCGLPAAPHPEHQTYFFRSGAMFLQASTSCSTDDADLSNISRSFAERSISTTRSTPLPPITTGTPTYMSLTPYSPLSQAAQGRTRFLSFR